MNPNPFVALLEYTPDRLRGREAEIATIADAISWSSGPLEIHGLPAMGKSSLLRYVADPAGLLARDRALLRAPLKDMPGRVFPVLVEYTYLPPNTHPFVYLCHVLHQAYPLYRERRITGTPDPQSAAALADLPTQPQTDGIQAVAECLYSALKQLALQRVRPVLLLDDFDIALAKMSPDQITLMRGWREFAAFVLTTERLIHQVNPLAAGSPFWQKASIARLGMLPADAARELVAEPARTAGCQFPPEDLDLLLRQAGGHPYLLILAARALWDLRTQCGLLQAPDRPLDQAQAMLWRGRINDDFRQPFLLYWESLAADERDVLQALVLEQPLTPPQELLLSALHAKGLLSDMRPGQAALKADTAAGRRPAGPPFTVFSPLFHEFVSATFHTPAPARARPEFTAYEQSLYAYLRSRTGEVCSFEDLLREVWKLDANTTGADLTSVKIRMRTTASRLRDKLRDAADEDIVSVRGQGYRLVAPVDRSGVSG